MRGAAAVEHVRANPLRRVRVPRDLAPISGRSRREVEAAAAGMTADGVARIWSAAQRLFRRGMTPALTLCVRREGQVVLDRSAGWVRGGGPFDPRVGEREVATPDTPDTPFCVYSSSKGVTATVVHLLAERGVLNLGDRITDHLPEFAGGGRDAITVAQVLSHRAGIPQIPREMMDLDRLDEPARILEAIPKLRSLYRPGSAVAYHTVSGGFVLGEVVRRAAGRDIRIVLADEILDPLGFRWGRFLTGIVPAGNVVSTANELSRFMELLCAGGTLDGVAVLSPRTIRRATAETSYHQIDRTLGVPVRYSLGYMLGARTLSPYGPDTDEAFGHLGYTS